MVTTAEIIASIAAWGSYVLLGFIIYYLFRAITLEEKEKVGGKKSLKDLLKRAKAPFAKKEKDIEEEAEEEAEEKLENEILDNEVLEGETLEGKTLEGKTLGKKISLFFNVLKISDKTKFKKELEKERILYNEFIELCEKKNTFVKNFLNLWNEIDKHNLKKVKQEYKSLIDKNKEIIKILNKIIVDKNIRNSIFFKLIVEQEKTYENLNKWKDEHKKEHILNIKKYVLKLNEELNFLKKYLDEENKYIKKEDIWETHKDLEEHGEFYRLIEGENTVFNNIKVNILNLLRWLQLIEKPSENIAKKLQKLRIMPVRYSNSEFREFYKNIYTKRFSKEEREEFDVLESSFKEHKRWPDDYAWHVLLAKINNVVVGGIVSEIFVYQIDDNEDETRKIYDMIDFYRDKFNVKIKNNKLCFGVVWWFATIEQKGLAKDIGKRLIETAFNAMEKEADSMGFKLSCVIEEADPTEISLIRFFKSFGIKECFKDYIQITSDGKYADHLTLYLLPISKFKNSIPRDDLLTIIECLQVNSNELKLNFLKKFPAYLKMVGNILKKKEHKLK